MAFVGDLPITVLAAGPSTSSQFFGSLLIGLREGLEGLGVAEEARDADQQVLVQQVELGIVLLDVAHVLVDLDVLGVQDRKSVV